MRDAYGPVLRQQLREADGTARTTGAGYRTITITLPEFIRNANIKKGHEDIYEMLMMLRFTRAEYKWSDYADIDQTLRLSRRRVGRSSDFRRRQVMHVGGSRANGFEIRNRGRVSLHQLDNLAAHFDRAVA